jgi:glyoxylase-like metal-dependent hydrolase (beta-lactamase superfamily II)
MTEQTNRINLGFVNAYLVQAGDGYILIDTGVAQQFARLENELLQAGCLPDKLRLVVITHGDSDHVGGCAELQLKYGAKIAIHPGDAEMVESGKPVKRQATSFAGKLMNWFGGFVGGDDSNSFKPDVLLQDGQRLEEYGLAARIIHTPGHTPGSIAILTDDGQLFAGDTVANRSRPALTPLVENEQELQNSLEILKQTNARIIFPGHGNPLSGEMFQSVH